MVQDLVDFKDTTGLLWSHFDPKVRRMKPMSLMHAVMYLLVVL